jgi:hypothetical protein
MARWERIDLDLPDDFPVASADELHVHLSDDRPGRTETVEWKEWATALNGCVYRFLGCDEALEDVVASLATSDSPPQQERTRQENLLFTFYAFGFSSLECLFYGLYFVGSLADPQKLPSNVNRLDINPRWVARRLRQEYAGDSLAIALDSVAAAKKFDELRLIRNALSHRGAPGRTFYEGGGPPSGVDWNLPITQLNVSHELTPPKLRERRAWLGTAVSEVFDAASKFAIARVP